MDDTYWGLSATAWTAYYTVLTAGLLLVAIAAALYARNQVRIARAAQREASRPYVIVAAEPSPIGWRVMDLVVRNIGQRPAYNGRVNLSPAPVRAKETPEAPITEVRWLKEVIPMLAPGQELRTFYDAMEERLNSARTDLPASHDYLVEYDERAVTSKRSKRDYKDQGVVDLNAMGGAMQPDVYNNHHAARALREIKKEIAKMNKPVASAQHFGNAGARSNDEIRNVLARRGPQVEPLTTVQRPAPPRLSGLRVLLDRLTKR